MTGDRIVWCKHHSQPTPLEDECAVGCDIPAFGSRGLGGFYKIPCHNRSKPDLEKATCEKAEWPTTAEIKAADAEREAITRECVDRLHKTLPLLNEIKEGIALGGVATCPVCETGSVRWTMAASNRHVAMSCTTDDCVRFME